MKKYSEKDYIRIRDFLVDTYVNFPHPFNWTIERWNFSISVARIMNGMSLDKWGSQIGIWEQNGEILSVVNAEGERDGEAFFQLAHENIPDIVIYEMFAFVDSYLGTSQNGKKTIYLRLPPLLKHFEEIAIDFGYTKLENTSPYAELTLKKNYPITLPQGFSFIYGDRVKAFDKGIAHAKAFGYVNKTIYRERSALAFQAMCETPDYRPDLDLHILSPDNEIAAFATMWYDERNRIGILEPVGTIPEYRKMGLGRANIMQLANQIYKMGGTKVYVGSDQDFYLRVGFQAHTRYGIWKKIIE